jgi:hypothetical protein
MSRPRDVLERLPWKKIGDVLTVIAAIVAIIAFIREIYPPEPPTPSPEPPTPSPEPPTPPPEPPTPTQTPIELIALTSPVSPTEYVTLVIQVAPGAVCDPGVIYKTGESEARGLGLKTAGSDGRLSWTWKCGSQTTPGTYRVYVECDPGGRMEWPIVVQ